VFVSFIPITLLHSLSQRRRTAAKVRRSAVGRCDDSGRTGRQGLRRNRGDSIALQGYDAQRSRAGGECHRAHGSPASSPCLHGRSENDVLAGLRRILAGFELCCRPQRIHDLCQGCRTPTEGVIREQWGVPIPPLDARMFERLMIACGEPGEIVVSGEHVLRGYLNGEGDAETKFEVDGVRWHRTGDLGYMDAAGRLWLLGRCTGKIQDARGTLYPFAVECAAMQTPAIRRAALAALDGYRVLALEGRETVSRDDILRSLSWAALDQVVFLDHIPVDRRHNAKVDYVALDRKLRSIRDSPKAPE
jgi:acyl-CoA synthetase (AMP-forming)/AMP-acid ligase II